LALIRDTYVSLYDSLNKYTDYSLLAHINHLSTDQNYFWVCHGVDGLCQYSIGEDSILTLRATQIKPNSPRRNWFHSVSWPQSGRLLVVGGCHNYSGINYPGTVMIYENDRWSYLDENFQTGLVYENLTEAVQDPNDPDHIFVGSTGQGLYEFKKGKFSKLYSSNNSALTSILNDTEYNKLNYVRISALQFDKEGNLWMANNETDTIIKVLEPDGNWFGLYYSEMSGLPTYKQMRFDDNGRLWINSSRGIKPGLFCIDLNGTPKNNKDDRIKYSGSVFTNQDGTTEEIYDVYFYEWDLNGEIWMGTNRGIFVLRNPDDFINDPNPVFERIKIARNDGSGLADYLFNGVMTTCMYIDQGNRKWIGTLNQGVFLISADGTQTLEHFTSSNSPLPSDNILSITEDGLNGSLFFGTSLGMVEYGGQARDPEETLSESNILVYPNPVKPGFDGYVTITGLTEWSTIRITDNSGRLINMGTSNGGSYSWNLTDMNGRQVSSGVYHAIITDSDNNKSESTSITIVR
jgi:ligand-binding sensor domain-containing protein